MSEQLSVCHRLWLGYKANFYPFRSVKSRLLAKAKPLRHNITESGIWIPGIWSIPCRWRAPKRLRPGTYAIDPVISRRNSIDFLWESTGGFQTRCVNQILREKLSRIAMRLLEKVTGPASYSNWGCPSLECKNPFPIGSGWENPPIAPIIAVEPVPGPLFNQFLCGSGHTKGTHFGDF